MSAQHKQRKPRIPLSCEPCRSRKLKCNREKPCQNCIVRNKSGQCVFKGYEDSPSTIPKVRAEDLQERINRLENLVTSLVAQNSDEVQKKNGNLDDQVATPALASTSSEDLKHGTGVFTLEGNRSVYRGTTHWGDVLEELHELKNLWCQFQGNSDMGSMALPSLGPNDGAGILGGGIIKAATREEIIASLPSKSSVDKLLERFFDEDESPVPTFHILHRPTFEKECEEYWKNPAATSIMWLGKLFSMLAMTMVSYSLTCDEPAEYEGKTASLAELYRLRTAQCLVIGDITKCVPHTLETLIFNVMAEWALSKNQPKRVWMMCGIMVRVGIQMGYHRDPSHYLELSILEGEIRRRNWAFTYRLDSLSSFLVGLPSMVRALETDSLTPRNLFDSDLNEEMTELPPSRPNTQITPVSYLLAKDGLLAVIGKIVDFLSSLKQYSYDRALQLDNEFLEAYANIPPHFQTVDLESLRTINTSLANRRIQMIFLYHHGCCVLHRKFLVQGRTEPRFAFSYKRCIDSAMTLLRLQNVLYSDAQAKGKKVARHWYRVSYMTQEFILPTMVLTSDLKHRQTFVRKHDTLSTPIQQEDLAILQMLRTACNIWKNSRDTSEDAVKVYNVLSYMLGNLDDSNGPVDQDTTTITLVSAEDPTVLNNQQGYVPNFEMDFDWAAWDTFVEGASFEETYGNYPIDGQG